MKAGAPRLGARVCGKDRRHLVARRARRGTVGAARGLRTPSGLGEPGERRPWGSDPGPGLTPPARQLLRGNLRLLAAAQGPPNSPGPHSPSSRRPGLSAGLGAGGRGEGPGTAAGPGQPAALVLRRLPAVPSAQQCPRLGSHWGAFCFGGAQAGSLVRGDLALWVIPASLCASEGNPFQVSGDSATPGRTLLFGRV